MGAAKGFAALGPLGALAGGVQVSKDPLGQFAYQQLVAQEERDATNAALANMASGLGGLSAAGDVSSATTSGGDFGGSYDGAGFGTGDEGAGFSDGSISGGSFGDSYGGDSYGGDSYGGWYKGGLVTADRLSGPNPKTPDDGYGALQDGEYVIKASSVKKYGKGLLADINSGKYKA